VPMSIFSCAFSWPEALQVGDERVEARSWPLDGGRGPRDLLVGVRHADLRSAASLLATSPPSNVASCSHGTRGMFDSGTTSARGDQVHAVPLVPSSGRRRARVGPVRFEPNWTRVVVHRLAGERVRPVAPPSRSGTGGSSASGRCSSPP